MHSKNSFIDSYERLCANLKTSLDARRRFDKVVSELPEDYLNYYIWDIPISTNDFGVTKFRSADSGPLAGVTRLKDWNEFVDEPLLGADLGKIPKALRERSQWIWLDRDDTKTNFCYKPYRCRGVKEEEGLLPKNWMAFHPIDWTHDKSACANGYVLNNDLIKDDLRLVAIVISPQSGLNNNDVRALWVALGKPYLEYSKDGLGWKILGLVDEPLDTVNARGVNIFTSGDFVELSGLGAKGSLVDISETVGALHCYRFPSGFQQLPIHNSRPMTPREVARLKEMINYISADCSYDTYMRVIWGVLSTGWPIAEQIALEWSLTAAHRFEQKTFDALVKSHDPLKTNPTTMGTIYHLARAGGWRG